MKKISSLLFAAVLAVPAVSAQLAADAPTSKASSNDPISMYKEAGIDSSQEGEIRKLVKEFESAHRVRLKVVFRLIKEMRDLQLQPDPASEEVLAKQDEINKETSKIATERVKLMLKIRSILNLRQKEKLVELVKLRSGQSAAPQAE